MSITWLSTPETNKKNPLNIILKISSSVVLATFEVFVMHAGDQNVLSALVREPKGSRTASFISYRLFV